MNASDIKSAASDELNLGARLDFTDRSVCVRNMQFLFHIITATEQLLWEARNRSDGALRNYFESHRLEETGHADWLKDDLENDVGQADMLCAAMVGAMYYMVLHVDSCALLGYQLVLECFPVPLERIEALESLHGKRLFRTLRHHAVHDVEHGSGVLEQINKLTPDRINIVLQSAIHTARCAAAASHSFASKME